MSFEKDIIKDCLCNTRNKTQVLGPFRMIRGKKNGAFLVQYDDRSWNFIIAKTGQTVSTENFHSAYSFNHGFALVRRKDHTCNYLKKDGTFALKNWYYRLNRLNDMLVCKKKHSRTWEVIDINENVFNTFDLVRRIPRYNKFIGENRLENSFYFFSTTNSFRKVQIPQKRYYVSENCIEFPDARQKRLKFVLSIEDEKFLSNNLLESIGWFPKVFLDRKNKEFFFEGKGLHLQRSFIGPSKEFLRHRYVLEDGVLLLSKFNFNYMRIMNRHNFVKASEVKTTLIENWA